MIAHEELKNGDVVWAAWAYPSTSEGSKPAIARVEKVEVISAADRLVRRNDAGLGVLYFFESVFSTECEARQHVVKVLDGIVAEIRSIADRFR